MHLRNSPQPQNHTKVRQTVSLSGITSVQIIDDVVTPLVGVMTHVTVSMQESIILSLCRASRCSNAWPGAIASFKTQYMWLCGFKSARCGPPPGGPGLPAQMLTITAALQCNACDSIKNFTSAGYQVHLQSWLVSRVLCYAVSCCACACIPRRAQTLMDYRVQTISQHCSQHCSRSLQMQTALHGHHFQTQQGPRMYTGTLSKPSR